MLHVWIYSLASVAVVSLISLIGIATLAFQEERLSRWLFVLVSFSAGTLLGDVFLHMLPKIQIGVREGFYFLIGIVVFFVLERMILWHHSHTKHEEEIHSVAYLTLIGDGLHNFIDGFIIASSFLISTPLGIATTIAIIFHEIPDEIGNFAILVHGGWAPRKALFYNFISALPAVLGALIILVFAHHFREMPSVLLSFAASSFIYIAMSDLIPELQREENFKKSFWQSVWFVLGIATLALLLLTE